MVVQKVRILISKKLTRDTYLTADLGFTLAPKWAKVFPSVEKAEEFIAENHLDSKELKIVTVNVANKHKK